MTVVRLDEQRGLALCADAEGAHHTVETALIEPLAAGHAVLVHAGVAIASLLGEDRLPAGATCEDHSPAGATSVRRSGEEVAIPATPAGEGGAP